MRGYRANAARLAGNVWLWRLSAQLRSPFEATLSLDMDVVVLRPNLVHSLLRLDTDAAAPLDASLGVISRLGVNLPRRASRGSPPPLSTLLYGPLQVARYHDDKVWGPSAQSVAPPFCGCMFRYTKSAVLGGVFP
jgi:hypothetical protein